MNRCALSSHIWNRLKLIYCFGSIDIVANATSIVVSVSMVEQNGTRIKAAYSALPHRVSHETLPKLACVFPNKEGHYQDHVLIHQIPCQAYLIAVDIVVLTIGEH
jgi:Holliday junction resolvase-like predicted endonuclease